jgi:hypothetical protein
VAQALPLTKQLISEGKLCHQEALLGGTVFSRIEKVEKRVIHEDFVSKGNT